MNVPRFRWAAMLVAAVACVLAEPAQAHAQTSTTSGVTTSTGPPATTSTTVPVSTTSTIAVCSATNPCPGPGPQSAPGGGVPVERLPPTARTTTPPVARVQSARRLVDTGASTDRELTGAALLVCLGSALLVAGHVQRRRHRRIL